MLSDELADLLNLPPKASGFIVKTVAKDSPGALIGLRGATQVVTISGQEVPLGGDIILSIQDMSMTAANIAKIRDGMSRLPAGAPVKIVILRAGQVMELTAQRP